MSYVKRSLMNAMEGKFDPFVDILALQESQGAKFAEDVDPDWLAHKGGHNGKLYDMSCSFCQQGADQIQDQEYRWGEQREVVND